MVIVGNMSFLLVGIIFVDLVMIGLEKYLVKFSRVKNMWYVMVVISKINYIMWKIFDEFLYIYWRLWIVVLIINVCYVVVMLFSMKMYK